MLAIEDIVGKLPGLDKVINQKKNFTEIYNFLNNDQEIKDFFSYFKLVFDAVQKELGHIGICDGRYSRKNPHVQIGSFEHKISSLFLNPYGFHSGYISHLDYEEDMFGSAPEEDRLTIVSDPYHVLWKYAKEHSSEQFEGEMRRAMQAFRKDWEYLADPVALKSESIMKQSFDLVGWRYPAVTEASISRYSDLLRHVKKAREIFAPTLDITGVDYAIMDASIESIGQSNVKKRSINLLSEINTYIESQKRSNKEWRSSAEIFLPLISLEMSLTSMMTNLEESISPWPVNSVIRHPREVQLFNVWQDDVSNNLRVFSNALNKVRNF